MLLRGFNGVFTSFPFRKSVRRFSEKKTSLVYESYSYAAMSRWRTQLVTSLLGYTVGAMGRHFGEELKRLRTARGLTVRELAGQLGMPQTSYHAYERGVALPPARRRPALAKALGVTTQAIDDFVEEDEYEVFLRARSMSPAARNAVRDFIKQVRERERKGKMRG